VADSDVVKGLTAMGYQVTDAAKDAMVDALDAMSKVSGGSLVERVQRGGQNALFQMNTAIAKQLLKTLRPK
jgi:molybdenum-dependent DNA-binding transcriptional regulator ModE